MSKISDEIKNKMIKLALEITKESYCPYSKYPVGAALLLDNDEIITGVNVENASYGGTICAERTAVVTAITKGHRKFKGIAIATHGPTPSAPCGLCRQFMFEFGNMPVFLITSKNNDIITTDLVELLPRGFGPHSLDEFNNHH
uniref:Cytidine deaminase n=2 Tax=Panagrolaimus sp. JU765 TaxID=591449 RepID=A0AC34QUL4_9BILA